MSDHIEFYLSRLVEYLDRRDVRLTGRYTQICANINAQALCTKPAGTDNFHKGSTFANAAGFRVEKGVAYAPQRQPVLVGEVPAC